MGTSTASRAAAATSVLLPWQTAGSAYATPVWYVPIKSPPITARNTASAEADLLDILERYQKKEGNDMVVHKTKRTPGASV